MTMTTSRLLHGRTRSGAPNIRVARLAIHAAVLAVTMTALSTIVAACSRSAETTDADGPSLPGGIDGRAAFSAIEALTGPLYAGRIVGGDGSAAARAYLRARLEAVGLAVEGLEFIERVALNDGEAFLRARTPGGATTVFEYRSDFREAPINGFDGGRASGPLKRLTGSGFEPGTILLAPKEARPREIAAGLAAAGAAGLLFELDKSSPALRPLWPGHEPGALVKVKHGMPILGLSGEAFAALAAMVATAGADPGADAPFIELASPVRFADVIGTNLLAEWNGDGGPFEPAYLVMAHYDHVGADPDGSYFPGALDNASGVGVALALAEAAASYRPRVDLAFLFTDAEEGGLGGSTAFVSAPPFPLGGASVINLDMLGSCAETRYSVYSSGGQAGVSLSLRVERALSSGGIPATSEHPVDGSDHAPFASAGVAAVTVCEYDTEHYHRKDDLPEYLDTDELDAVGDALYRLIATATVGGP